MEIFMRNVPYAMEQLELTRKIADVLHKSPYFAKFMEGAPLNFKVFLFPDKKRRIRAHSGTGALTLPTVQVGEAFLGFFSVRGLNVGGRTIVFQRSKNDARNEIVDEIQRMPYRDPEVILEEEKRLAHLKQVVSLKDVQFAWQCRDETLSIEWQWNSLEDSGESYDVFELLFNDPAREIVIQGVESYGAKLVRLRYSHIQDIEIDPAAYAIVFVLDTPPSLEYSEHSFDDGGDEETKSQARDRLSDLGGTHRLVMPFAWIVMRFCCSSRGDLAEFKRMADIVKLKFQDKHHRIERRNLFSPGNLLKVWGVLRNLDYFVAFQCERLLRDLLLDPKELLAILPWVKSLIAEYGSERTTNILRQFGLLLRNLWYDNEDITLHDCLVQAIEQVQYSGPNKDSNDHLFDCLHVIITPTAMKLRGPFSDTSNRTLRRYSKNPEAFLRVSFMDEDGLNFRFDREVDNAGFIQKHVGSILKNGFTICGQKFEFLAYSQSALKQHTVWFVMPFTDKSGRRVTAQSIRDGIGSNWDPDLLRCPARFAARLSQAFTATNMSVTIEQDHIYHETDIERNGYCFSDGNGLASPDMFQNILGAQQRSRYQTTSVVQVRIQGAKGVISEAPHLDDFQLILRPSMVKFDATHHHEVEIARFFDKPTRFFLNRPLVMILHGLGVPEEAFMRLQAKAVKETHNATKSLQGAASLAETHGLGAAFALPSILLNLRKLGLDLEKENTSAVPLKDPFLNRCFDFAVHHVLREIKYKARIPVPESWKLVGIVDEYNVLKPRQIYACVVGGAGKPEYIKGRIMISKSPTIHPGDVQIVEAIGEPPANCALGQLVNCVVFSQQGDRPLPNQLSGSDLDGDEYDLVALASLHPHQLYKPGKYDPVPRHKLDDACTISDVADFVVDFINNDKLGVIANNFLQIADRHGIFHEDCLTLAGLHSWAVDFPKNGKPVPLDRIPRPGRIKPDWAAPEIIIGPNPNFYESQSILGKLFRDIKLSPLPEIGKDSRPRRRTQRRTKETVEASLEDVFQGLNLNHGDPISKLLHRKLARLVDLRAEDNMISVLSDLFDYFAAELEQISYGYSLSRRSTARLREEEVLMGTIIANTAQPRMRREYMSSMREGTTALTKCILKELEGDEDSSIGDWANRAWMAWSISITKAKFFGAKCFGFIALRSIFDAIKELEQYD